MAELVLDEQLANPRLVAALKERGIEVSTVADYGVTGRPMPTWYGGSANGLAGHGCL